MADSGAGERKLNREGLVLGKAGYPAYGLVDLGEGIVAELDL